MSHAGHPCQNNLPIQDAESFLATLMIQPKGSRRISFQFLFVAQQHCRSGSIQSFDSPQKDEKHNF